MTHWVTMEIHTDDLDLLLAVLPAPLRQAAASLERDGLLEIIMDLGRRPQARYAKRAVDLSEAPVSADDIATVVNAVGEFSADNRAGIEGTLHRISAIHNRRGHIIGLTLRVGRAVYGTIDPILDQIEAGKSLLLLGPPGVGKTTRLREAARVLADSFGKRVVVIDTSNEIGGDGDVPHPAIGSARRMQVAHPSQQHAVMIEAVENHMPEVIVVDEIGTAQEALAARTIAERGVQLIATAHGTTLENLIQNPTLSDLVGGVQTVTLTDEEARLRGTQKTVNERKQPPTFDVVVEILDRDELVVHPDAANAVDNLLRGRPSGGILRRSGGEEEVLSGEPAPPPTPWAMPTPRNGRQTAIFVYGLARDSVERAIRDLRLNARTVASPDRADMVLAQRARAADPRLQRLLMYRQIPLHTVRKNTTSQIRRVLQDVFNRLPGLDEAAVDAAIREAEDAALRVREQGVPLALAPQPPALRKLQHKVIVRHQLSAHSQGSEPERRLVIYPD